MAFPPTGSPGGATSSGVATATLTFIDANNAVLETAIFHGLSSWRPITRQAFGPPATCTFGAQPNLTLATNYQDLWWAAPPGSESGWGVNLAHQGDVIFATWFIYDQDRAPLWLSAVAPKIAPGVYSGTIFRTSQSLPEAGAPFFLGRFDSTRIVGTQVGSLTLAFANGNSAAFTYTVDAVTQTKQITRQVFRAPGTVCH